jgi:hypothetical protein
MASQLCYPNGYKKTFYYIELTREKTTIKRLLLLTAISFATAVVHTIGLGQTLHFFNMRISTLVKIWPPALQNWQISG